MSQRTGDHTDIRQATQADIAELVRLRALLFENLGGEREVARVDLYASAEGEPLHRDLGFVNHPDPALYWRP
ncbi:hypothetical protein ACFQ7F_04665 [Streptomyces sp. NPDC056486]|uniref:hypothetical protein n=1 Tax=Streptomyces sp. NPDC056486 TaxID=3345835 RepID=UPI0036BA3467